MMLNISIVIYNSPFDQISSLINSLRNSAYVDQVYLVDNSSFSNKEMEKLDAVYIFNGKNLGYGAAHNIAISKTIQKGIKYHLILNPDIRISEDNIKIIIKYMENNPGVGLLMPKVFYPDGELQYLCKLLPSPSDLIFRRFSPFRKHVARKNQKYELRFTGYNNVMEVPSLSGCFMFTRTSVLNTTGGFDTRYFMYVEDLDLCRRIGQKSKTVYFPIAEITHDYEKGSYKSWKLLYFHAISAIKYFNKWGWFFDRERKKINNQTMSKLTNSLE